MKKKVEITPAGTPILAIHSGAPKEFLAMNGLRENHYRAASEGAKGIINSSSTLKLLWKGFMVALYRDNDLDSAGAIGRKMIKEASLFGNAERDKIIDWVDAERYAYANSGKGAGRLPPEKIMGKLLYDIPELRDSSHHAAIEQRQYDIAVACGWGMLDKAIGLANDAAKFAWGIGNRWLAYEFELQKMHFVMQKHFKENDLAGAISVARQAVGFSYSIGRQTPDWLLEGFFIYAHQEGRKPSVVRAEVLAAIPNFPTNHVVEATALKGEIEDKIIFRRSDYAETKPEYAAGLAKRLAEFSFLAPEETYEGVRAWIRDTFENFAKDEIAKYNNYTPEKVRGMLAKQIPDIYDPPVRARQ